MVDWGTDYTSRGSYAPCTGYTSPDDNGGEPDPFRALFLAVVTHLGLRRMSSSNSSTISSGSHGSNVESRGML